MIDRQATALEEALPRMSDEHQTFARALLGQLELRQALTEREWFWIGELIRRYPPPQAYQLEGNLGPMVAMMIMAQTRLLHPKVRIIAPFDAGQGDWDSVELSMDRHAGHVVVDYPGGMAKITGDGVLVSQRAIPQYIISALNEFSKDPMQAALAYARRTGFCCFCGIRLEDERSVRVGYGPTCAKHYNLPFPKERTAEGMLAKLEKF